MAEFNESLERHIRLGCRHRHQYRRVHHSCQFPATIARVGLTLVLVTKPEFKTVIDDGSPTLRRKARLRSTSCFEVLSSRVRVNRQSKSLLSCSFDGGFSRSIQCGSRTAKIGNEGRVIVIDVPTRQQSKIKLPRHNRSLANASARRCSSSLPCDRNSADQTSPLHSHEDIIPQDWRSVDQ